MTLREVQIPIYYDQHGQIQEEMQTFVYQPFTTTDLLSWKHHIYPLLHGKASALIDLSNPSSKLIIMST
jgi:hypothetical protein